jgi:hypothetical protein
MREMPAGWIWQMLFGIGLIALSLWGITLCPALFRTYIGKTPSPVDVSFANLAAAVAWFVFFGPIALAGLAVIWSALRKIGAQDWIEVLRERIGVSVNGTHAAEKPYGWGVSRSQLNFHDQLEGLSEEKAADLTKRAHRIATLLALFIGTFLIIIGVFG